MKSLICSITAIVLLASISYAAELKKEIVGRWWEEGKTEVLEFLEENTIVVTSSNRSFIGEYKFLDENRISIFLDGGSSLAGKHLFTVAISGDTLFLISFNGKTSEYIRIDLLEEDKRNLTKAFQANMDFIKGRRDKETLDLFTYYKDGKGATESDVKNIARFYQNVKMDSPRILNIFLLSPDRARVFIMYEVYGESKIETEIADRIGDRWYFLIAEHR